MQGPYALFLEFNNETKDYSILKVYVPKDRNKKLKAKHNMFLLSSPDTAIYNYTNKRVDQ